MRHWFWFLALFSFCVAAGYVYLRGQGVPVVEATEPDQDAALTEPTAEDWPCWRGAKADGTGSTAPPLHWSRSANVLWKVTVPGHGHASPIVWRGRVFVSTADERARDRLLLCYQLQDGKLLWSSSFHQGGFMARHERNSHASPTPACGGMHVYIPYVASGSLWVTAVDLEGKVCWQTNVGPFVSEWGYASSPAFYKNLVIVAGDNRGAKLGQMVGTTSYLAALHRQTGAIVWRVRRPRAFSYAAPIVADVAGQPQLLLSGAGAVSSYDPASGRERWQCRWGARRAANTMTFSSDCVFASAAFPDPEIVCIRADGSGDVSDTHVLWRKRKGACDVTSPLYHDSRLYVIGEKGSANCFDAVSGTLIWQKRLGTTFSASPVLAAGRVYVSDEDGTTHVFKAGPGLEPLATNPLAEPVYASPAIAGSRLLLRSAISLWCVGGD